MPAGNADLRERGLDQDLVEVGGGPGPTVTQMGALGQVTVLPKTQFPHEMKLQALLLQGTVVKGDSSLCLRGL